MFVDFCFDFVNVFVFNTWGTHPADEKGCESLSSHENIRNPGIHYETNVFENEPGHILRSEAAFGIIRDDV